MLAVTKASAGRPLRLTLAWRTFGAMNMVGRLLQIAGLTVLPVAVLLEMMGRLGRRGLSDMLLLMVFGAVSFYLGRYLEGYARSH